MSAKTSEELRKEIIERYNKQPSDWRLFVSRDARGRTNYLFAQGNDIWFLKEEAVNPYQSVGFGVKESGILNLEMPKTQSFGFRPLPSSAMKAIARALEEARDPSVILQALTAQKPQPLPEMIGRPILQGPVYYSPKPTELFQGQRELDQTLTAELNRLLAKKYPHLLTTYT